MGTDMPLSNLAILDDLANTEESVQKFGQTILDAFRDFRDSHDTAAEVFVFTGATEGHSWKIQMTKTATSFSGFEFTGFHQPPPCSAFCEPGLEQLLLSEHLHLVYRRVGDHIAEIANGGAGICRRCERILRKYA